MTYQHDEQLMQLIRMLADEIADHGPSTALMQEGLATAIAAALARIDLAAADAEAERIHLPQARLKRVTDYIDANLHARLAIAGLAEEAGLSPFHFSRVFRRETGATVWGYVTRRRIERACQLLHDSRIPIASIAHVTGFADQSHFTSAFARETGVTPARYRKLHTH